MLRNILDELEWAIAFVLITLIIFLIIANLTIQPAIATITETEITPRQVNYRSEQVLTDATGQKWQVMLFTQSPPNSSQIAPLNLRLSGIASTLPIQSQKPLVIKTLGDRYEATNIFLTESPLPSIGQYDLKSVFPQLPTAELLLEIPLENGEFTLLNISKEVVKEWQEVAAKNLNLATSLPTSIPGLRK
ncbi:MAG TPA: DUF3122 domain-containing protein [Xenococcaceae cyanobacterium]|jgi:hypothetical protein